MANAGLRGEPDSVSDMAYFSRKGKNVITHKIKSGGAGYGFYCNISEPGFDLSAYDPDAKERKRTEWFYDPDYRQNPPYQYHYW